MRTLIIFIVIVLSTAQAYSQIAVITDLKVGEASNNLMIRSVFDSINKNNSIKQVVFIGNLTSTGNREELDSLFDLLNSLNPDNYILPGQIDISNNPLPYLYIRDQFDGTRIRLDSSGLFLAGLSNYPPRGSHISFSTSDLMWLDSLFNAVDKNKKLFFFTSAALSLNDNWTKVYNLLTTHASRFIFSPGKENSLIKFEGIDQISFKPTINKNGWNYNIISEINDTLYLQNIAEDTLITTWETIPVSGSETAVPIDSQYTLNYASKIFFQKETGKDIVAPVLPTEDRIFYVSLNGEVESFDYSGKSLWKINLARTVVTKPLRNKDLLIIGTVEGDLFSINANNGNIVQVIGTEEPILTDPVLADVENPDGKFKGIIIGSPSGKVTCYDIYTFQLLWENTSAEKKINCISVINGKFFFTSSDGFLYSADITNGNLIWKWNPGKNITLASLPEIGDQFIYISGSNKTLFAIDLLLGTTAWKKTEFGQPYTIHYLPSSKELVIKTFKDEIITADALTGKVLRKDKTGFPADNSHSFILDASGDILFSSSDGFIRRIHADQTTEYIFYLGGGQISEFTETPKGDYLLSNDKGNFYIFSL